jgi:hypothetical protein
MALSSLFPELYSSINDFQQKVGHIRRNIVSE